MGLAVLSGLAGAVGLWLRRGGFSPADMKSVKETRRISNMENDNT